LTSLLSVFREPGRLLVMPPATEGITPDTVIDIPQEGLMRMPNRLKGWVEKEAESASQYIAWCRTPRFTRKTLPVDDRPRTLAPVDWYQTRRPHAAGQNDIVPVSIPRLLSWTRAVKRAMPPSKLKKIVSGVSCVVPARRIRRLCWLRTAPG